MNFLFMLGPATERHVVQRVIHTLTERFPKHHFEACEPVSDFENMILPIKGTAGDEANPGVTVDIDQAEAGRVREVFEGVLEEAKGWRLG